MGKEGDVVKNKPLCAFSVLPARPSISIIVITTIVCAITSILGVAFFVFCVVFRGAVE